MSDNPITDAAAAENEGASPEFSADYMRLVNSGAAEVRNALAIMDTLVLALDAALALVMNTETPDDQVKDVENMFAFIIGYFRDMNNMLAELSMNVMIEALQHMISDLPDDTAPATE